MLSLLLITALAVQTPAAAKPSTDTTAQKRVTTTAPATRGTSQSAVSRTAFHDRMRDLWNDHVVYTHNFIVSASAGLADTAELSQRLMRNQDELGEAIKPYYGEAAGSQLASLLRNHIQLAGKALLAAKGTSTAMQGMKMQDSAGMSGGYLSNRASDTVSTRTDSVKLKGSPARMSDTSKVKANANARAKQPNSRVTGDTVSQRLPTGQYGNVRPTDSTQVTVSTSQATYAQTQTQMQGQVTQVDSVALNQAIADLKANGDSIAEFLSTANPRGFAREPLRAVIQMHVTLLLKEATARINKDWSGSIAAFEEGQHQAMQMADMLSDGIIKQFPSRFTNRATAVSLR